MSFGFFLLAFTVALNPPLVRLAAPRRVEVLVLGSLVALAVGAALAATAKALLDALDISPESLRLAAGLVLALEGLRVLVLPRPAAEAALPGLGAALVPVAFPLLLQPGVVMLSLAAGGDGSVGEAVGALAVALALVVLAAAVPVGPRTVPLLAAGGRLLGAIEIAAGAALAVDAIRDV
jgi:small neutral amino acid transporter SnatA (MarC family)